MIARSSTGLQEYYNSGRMMFKLAEALGRLALAGRELTRLSGFTTRVDSLINVLHELEDGKYQRTMVGGTQAVDAIKSIEDLEKEVSRMSMMYRL